MSMKSLFYDMEATNKYVDVNCIDTSKFLAKSKKIMHEFSKLEIDLFAQEQLQTQRMRDWEKEKRVTKKLLGEKDAKLNEKDARIKKLEEKIKDNEEQFSYILGESVFKASQDDPSKYPRNANARQDYHQYNTLPYNSTYTCPIFQNSASANM